MAKGGGLNLKFSERAPPYLVPPALFPFPKRLAAWVVKVRRYLIPKSHMSGRHPEGFGNR